MAAQNAGYSFIGPVVRVTAINETAPLPPHGHQETNTESVYRSIAGIDIHKKILAVVIRRSCGEQIEYQKREFGTTRREIQHVEASSARSL